MHVCYKEIIISYCHTYDLHKLIRVNGSPNEVASMSEILTGIPQHHVSFFITLKGVVYRELTASQVEPTCSILVPVPKTYLGGGGGIYTKNIVTLHILLFQTL